MKACRRFVSLMLVLVTLCSLMAIPALAASAWPTLSSSGYCEMIAPFQFPVYRDSSLKTPGTCSPAKSYNAYVSKNDKIYILKITDQYIQLSYPTSAGRKQAFVSTSTLFGVTSPAQVFTARARVTTYRYTSTGSSYGYVDVGDQVYQLGSTKNGYFLILYPAVSGSRRYKAAFVTSADFSRLTGSGSQTVSTGQTMSYALYQRSGGRLTCGFDGYVNTKGRHEGIDFARGYGSAVYSLTDGVVTRVKEGYNGSSGLSLIAIYSPSTNKTVIYLHTDPLNSLKEGQSVSRGQQIATEAWRGCSSSGGTHTHVEVRDGRKTSAAKSVNDYTLSNPNPTAFWNSQGYQVK